MSLLYCTLYIYFSCIYIYIYMSRLAIRRLVIKRNAYNVGRHGPRMSAARREMGATANNNAAINCHLFL